MWVSRDEWQAMKEDLAELRSHAGLHVQRGETGILGRREMWLDEIVRSLLIHLNVGACIPVERPPVVSFRSNSHASEKVS